MSATKPQTVNKLLELKLKELESLKRKVLTKFIFGQIKTPQDLQPFIGFHKEILPSDFALTKESISAIFSAEAKRIVAEESEEQFTAQAKVIEPSAHVKADDYPELPWLKENQRVRYIPWQNRGAVDIIRKLVDEQRRAVLLQAMGGYGKTYILGAVIKELWHRQWQPLMNNISPYPCVYITRASIVEQTERVLYQDFGLKKFREVFVTNIEQMRSTFGEKFVETKTVVRWGQSEITYKWYPLLKPALMVIDESQSVKNDDSEQSKIMQAWAEQEPEDPWTACVHSSATPFTRVSEAHTLAVATGLEFHL